MIEEVVYVRGASVCHELEQSKNFYLIVDGTFEITKKVRKPCNNGTQIRLNKERSVKGQTNKQDVAHAFVVLGRGHVFCEEMLLVQSPNIVQCQYSVTCTTQRGLVLRFPINATVFKPIS